MVSKNLGHKKNVKKSVLWGRGRPTLSHIHAQVGTFAEMKKWGKEYGYSAKEINVYKPLFKK